MVARLRIGWYITNVCFTQIFLVELLVRWFVEGRVGRLQLAIGIRSSLRKEH